MYHLMEEFYNAKKIDKKEIEKKLKQSQIVKDMFFERAQIEIYCDRFYSNHDFNDEKDEVDYQNIIEEGCELFYEFCKVNKSERCIIAPISYPAYFEDMFDLKDNELYNELIEILKYFSVNKRSYSGIEVGIFDEMHIIQKFIMGGMRFISNAKLFLPEQNIVFVPHHHTNFYIFTNDKNVYAKILQDIVKEHPNFEISM